MARYRSSRVVPVILLLVVVAVAIAALISVGRVIFFPNTNPDGSVSQVEVARENLLNTSTEHAVRMVVRGEIVAGEDHRSYEIIVAPESRTMTVYKGYSGVKEREVRLSNSPAAYEQFVYALNRAGVVDGRELSDQQNDTRGICASGNLYSFDVLAGGQVVRNNWTTTCRDIKGSLNERPTELKELFLAQIPKGKEIISKIDL